MRHRVIKRKPPKKKRSEQTHSLEHYGICVGPLLLLVQVISVCGIGVEQKHKYRRKNYFVAIFSKLALIPHTDKRRKIKIALNKYYNKIIIQYRVKYFYSFETPYYNNR